MSERVAKERRREAREAGEDVRPIRARVTNGEVQNLLGDLRGEVADALDTYNREVLLPLVQATLVRAARYQPLWLRLWMRWKFYRARRAGAAAAKKALAGKLGRAS